MQSRVQSSCYYHCVLLLHVYFKHTVSKTFFEKLNVIVSVVKINKNYFVLSWFVNKILFTCTMIKSIIGLGSHRPLSGQLYKYTNVVKGWQQRWFAVDPETGVLSYYLFDGPGDTVQPGQPARGEVRRICLPICYPQFRAMQQIIVLIINK